MIGLLFSAPGQANSADGANGSMVEDGNSVGDAPSQATALDRLVEESDLIVRGFAVQSVGHWNADHSAIVTDNQFKVHYAVAGSAPAKITVRTMGGIVQGGVQNGVPAEAIGMVQTHTSFVHANEEILLFLSRDGDVYTPTFSRAAKYVVDGESAISPTTGRRQPLSELYAMIERASLKAGVARSLAPNWRELEAQLSVKSAQRLDAAVNDSVDSPATDSVDNFVDNGRRWPADNLIVDFYVNINTEQAGGADGSMADFRGALIDAGHTWSSVPTSSIALRYAGATTAQATGLNGVNEILFSNDMQDGVLGQARIWYNPSTSIIVETDMRINNSHDFDALGSPTAQEVDLQSIVLHELGHWFSLGHDSDPAAVMYQSMSYGVVKRELHSTDAAGISSLYPCPQASCIHPWVPVDDEIVEEPQPANQFKVEPGEACAPEFVDEATNSGVKLDIPVGAVTEPTTILYDAGGAPVSAPGSAYQYAGYDFQLETIQDGEQVDEFSFRRTVPLEVRYGSRVDAALDETALRLFIARDGEWREADCGAYQHMPTLDRFVVPVCELGEFALFVPAETQTPNPIDPSKGDLLFLPVVQN